MMRNPFQYLLPVAPAAFVGRWSLVKRMALDLLLDGGDSHAIIAGRRCGKSSLCNALAHWLRQPPAVAESGDWRALPLVFDFKAATFTSVEAFLARILSEVRRRVDVAARRRPADAWPTPVRLEAGWFESLAAAPELPLRDFEDALGYVLDQLDTPELPVRLVLLLDEVDETLDQPWVDALFNQLRALIYSGDLKDRVRLVLAGSRRFLDQVSDRGSPLWNVLKLQFLTSFDRSGFDELSARWPGVSGADIEAVWVQSSGHPFLAQYLLHHAWQVANATAVEQFTPILVMQLTQRFYAEQAQDLLGWANGVEMVGLRAYHVLSQSSGWLTEAEVAAQVADSAVAVKRGLTALCYHGVILHDNWSRYQYAGELFRTWLTFYRSSLSDSDSQSPEPTLPPGTAATFDERSQHVGIQVNIAGDLRTGSVQNPAAALAVLEQLQAAIQRAAASGQLTEETANVATEQVGQALQRARSGEATAAQLVPHLQAAQAIIPGIARDLMRAVDQAMRVVQAV